MTRNRELAAVAVGGAAGALLRTWAGLTFTTTAGAWPWTTFTINVTGAFVLATLAGWLAARPGAHGVWRPLVGAGFCGGYTTFSTFEVELVKLGVGHHVGLALGYAVASVAAGVGAARLGTRITGAIPAIGDDL